MSFAATKRVWTESKHAGTELLVLLALADFTWDEGLTYPSVATLARKCRMKPRNVHYILAALKESGELQIDVGKGPNGTNLYRITLGRGMHVAAGVQPTAEVQPSALTPAPQCGDPLHRLASKSLVNHQESKRRIARDVLTSLPDGFSISSQVRDWAAAKGFSAYLDDHFEHMVSAVKANGKCYADWDEALKTYIRCDYGDVRKRAETRKVSMQLSRAKASLYRDLPAEVDVAPLALDPALLLQNHDAAATRGR